MMTMNSHGMIAKTCFWISSVGAGLSFCWSHMVMPSRIGSTQMAMNDGGVNGNRPNRLTGDSGSGADRPLIHSPNGRRRISIVSLTPLYTATELGTRDQNEKT